VKKLVINQRDYNGMISKICRDIVLSKWRPDYIVGMAPSGALPALMISEYFGVPVEFLAENVSNCGMSQDAFGYDTQKKNILIIDGINNSSELFSWVKQDWTGLCFPHHDVVWNNVWNNNVKFAAVIHDESSNFKELDYYGSEINSIEEPTVVEFPFNIWWVK